MSKFLEIGEILDLPAPTIEIISQSADVESLIKTKKNNYALPLLIGAVIIVGLIYFTKHEYEKNTNPRNK